MEPKEYLKCPSCKKLKKRKQFYWDKRTHWRCMHCAGLQVKVPETIELQLKECIELLKNIICNHSNEISPALLPNLAILYESLNKIEEYY